MCGNQKTSFGQGRIREAQGEKVSSSFIKIKGNGKKSKNMYQIQKLGLIFSFIHA